MRSKLSALAAGTAAVMVLGGCASHHRVAAIPTTTSSIATTTTVAPTTTTAKPDPVAPLTGLPQANAAQIHQPAVVVKIDNVDQARPQTGINQTDIVYEEMVEGGLTRLAAIFQSQYPPVVGPVRSGRLTDEGIADDLSHPVYVFSGTNAIFLPILDSQPVTAVNGNNHGEAFYRIGSNAPHNLYSNVANLAKLSTSKAAPNPLFAYLGTRQAFGGFGAAPVSHIAISFPNAAITWDFDKATQKWVRGQNGTADLDSAGQQANAANVVVMFVSYVTSGMATGEGGPPAPIPEGILTGTGQAWFLSSGKIVKGTWTRPNLTTPATYKDAAGKVVRLTRGRTWIELVPLGSTPSLVP